MVVCRYCKGTGTVVAGNTAVRTGVSEGDKIVTPPNSPVSQCQSCLGKGYYFS